MSLLAYLVTGAVLHCLPGLEKSVAMRSLKDRSLKIIRVETSQTSQRMVGMRYPVDDDAAVVELRSTMTALDVVRIGSNSTDLFVDEIPDVIVAKSIAWVTTAPKTMKSFFQTSSTKTRLSKGCPNGGGVNLNKRMLTSAGNDGVNGNEKPKKQQKKVPRVNPTTKKRTTASKKATAITSFFKKV